MPDRTNQKKKRSRESRIVSGPRARRGRTAASRKAALALVDLITRVHDDVRLALVLFGFVEELDKKSYERLLVLDCIRSVIEHAREEFTRALEQRSAKR